MNEIIEFINKNLGVFTLFFTAVVAIATVVYVRLTRKLVNETIELRRIQTRPELSISILPRDPEVWIVDMIIENVGNGAAHNIQIKPSSNFEMRDNREFNNIGFVKNGYKYFAPHQKVKFFFTNLIDKKDEKEKTNFDIYVSYEDYSGEKYQTTYKVNLSEFYGIPRLGNPPLYDIAESLKKIEIILDRLLHKKIEMNIYNKEDREEEKQKLKDEVKHLKDKGLLKKV
jgi:hypothetical protein